VWRTTRACGNGLSSPGVMPRYILTCPHARGLTPGMTCHSIRPQGPYHSMRPQGPNPCGGYGQIHSLRVGRSRALPRGRTRSTPRPQDRARRGFFHRGRARPYSHPWGQARWIPSSSGRARWLVPFFWAWYWAIGALPSGGPSVAMRQP
jgi:hypothetical protein